MVCWGVTLDLPLARRDVVAARLAAGQAVVAVALAAEFGVSEDAIRRDLRALAAEGRCRRVYGGALPVTPATVSMAARVDIDAERKRRLARVGAATIRSGELVFLDCGSTNLAVVEFLAEDVTVATNAVDIAARVLARQDVRLIVVGGLADPIVGGCVDAAALQAVSRLRIDRCFVGTCSISLERGLGAFHFEDATFKHALVAASRCKVVLAADDKFDTRTPHQVAALSEIDVMVVEAETEQSRIAALERRGCRDVRRAL